MKSLIAIALAAALLAWPSAPAGAAPSNEYDLLRQIPPGVLDTVTRNDYPDATGAMQNNIGGWRNIVYQRVAIPLIWTGAAENDPAKVDAGWHAITLAMQHLQPDGSYDSNGEAMTPSNMSFWIDAVAHAMVVLQESPLGPRYSGRIARVTGVLRQNVDWLRSQPNLSVLDHNDGGAVNRTLVDAGAFQFMAKLTGDASLRRIGQHFAQEAQSRQLGDGTLLEQGGFDSNYQAVSLLHGAYYALNFVNPNLRPMLGRALNRELQAIRPDGSVDVSQNTRTGRDQEFVNGRPKVVSVSTVALALYYNGYLLGNDAALNAASRVYATLR